MQTVKGEDYATVWLLDYGYLKNFYRMNLSNTQELDSDPKAIQQIIFTANLDRDGIIKCFSLLIKEKGTILELWPRSCESIVNLFYFNIILWENDLV